LSILFLSQCRTYATREFVDEYGAIYLKSGKPKVTPLQRDFHGWDVSVSCIVGIDYRVNGVIDENKYGIVLDPKCLSESCSSEKDVARLRTDSITLFTYPDENTYVVTGGQEKYKSTFARTTIIPPTSQKMYFGKLVFSNDIDSIRVRYRVFYTNVDLDINDSEEFDYTLYRFEKKRKVPFLFLGE